MVRARGPGALLNAAETARRVGSSAYAGSLLDMRAGTLQPLAYARGLAHAAVRAGVSHPYVEPGYRDRTERQPMDGENQERAGDR